MRFLLAAILGAHGVAHLVGFVSSWRLMTLPEMPYKTTTLGGRLDLGDVGVRMLGGLWLLAALAFFGCAVAFASEVRVAARLTILACVASLVLCAAEWPASRIGLAVNLALLAVLWITRLSTAATQ